MEIAYSQEKQKYSKSYELFPVSITKLIIICKSKIKQISKHGKMTMEVITKSKCKTSLKRFRQNRQKNEANLFPVSTMKLGQYDETSQLICNCN